jgi:tRNA dimethylallyltransferase
MIGLTWPKKELAERIKIRLLARLEKEDLIGEVRRLHREGVSWERLESFGLEYKFTSRYLQKKITYDELTEQLNRAISRFARRQLTWFKRWEKQGKAIHWLKEKEQAETLINEFIK